MKSLGKKIKSLRQQKDWTQKDVSEQLGISVPAYSKIETGITDINLSRLIQISKLFDMTINQLFTLDEEKESSIHLEEIEALNKKVKDRDIEISTLQKKLIDAYETLNKNN
jgi:transcriptional regulator with XRE-family HTH domain